MPFVMLNDDDAYRACHRLTLSLGYPYTLLAGKQDRSVLVLPESVLEELTDRHISFTIIPPAALPDHLSPQGYAGTVSLRNLSA